MPKPNNKVHYDPQMDVTYVEPLNGKPGWGYKGDNSKDPLLKFEIGKGGQGLTNAETMPETSNVINNLEKSLATTGGITAASLLIPGLGAASAPLFGLRAMGLRGLTGAGATAVSDQILNPDASLMDRFTNAALGAASNIVGPQIIAGLLGKIKFNGFKMPAKITTVEDVTKQAPSVTRAEMESARSSVGSANARQSAQTLSSELGESVREGESLAESVRRAQGSNSSQGKFQNIVSKETGFESQNTGRTSGSQVREAQGSTNNKSSGYQSGDTDIEWKRAGETKPTPSGGTVSKAKGSGKNVTAKTSENNVEGSSKQSTKAASSTESEGNVSGKSHGTEVREGAETSTGTTQQEAKTQAQQINKQRANSQKSGQSNKTGESSSNTQQSSENKGSSIATTEHGETTHVGKRITTGDTMLERVLEMLHNVHFEQVGAMKAYQENLGRLLAIATKDQLMGLERKPYDKDSLPIK